MGRREVTKPHENTSSARGVTEELTSLTPVDKPPQGLKAKSSEAPEKEEGGAFGMPPGLCSPAPPVPDEDWLADCREDMSEPAHAHFHHATLDV